MPDGEQTGKNFCTQCGSKISSDINFCTQCGIRYSSSTELDLIPSPNKESGSSDWEFFQGIYDKATEWSAHAAHTVESSTSENPLMRFLKWCWALPTAWKLFAGGILLLLLSPLVRVTAIVVLIVSAAVLIFRAVSRKPLKSWAILTVCALIVVPVFGGISNNIYGTGLLSTIASTGESEPDKPELTPQQRLEKNLELALADWQIRNVTVNGTSSDGYQIYVDFDARCSSCSDQKFVNTIEQDSESVYREIFTSSYGPNISSAIVTSYHVMISSEDGSESDDVIFKTSVDGMTGRDVRWENSSYIDFYNVWEVEDVNTNFDDSYDDGYFDLGDSYYDY